MMHRVANHQRNNVVMNWLRNTRRQKPYEAPYYLIDNQSRPRRFSAAHVAKAVGAILTSLTLVTGLSALYERSKATSLNLSLDQTSSGYFLRVVNSGNATALAVRMDLESWPVGAPGSWRRSFPPRDLPPGSDTVVPMEFLPPAFSESLRSEILEGLTASVLSGFVMVTCNNCTISRNWAFSIPGYRSKGGEIYARSGPPLVALERRDDRPRIGYCVDIPAGVCGGNPFAWVPGKHL
ncbi:MAG: hypothetical protein LAO30_25980 [Acidobacteriia bacterium]|nr:hypothetical protein [Terriglobia bacterium]